MRDVMALSQHYHEHEAGCEYYHRLPASSADECILHGNGLSRCAMRFGPRCCDERYTIHPGAPRPKLWHHQFDRLTTDDEKMIAVYLWYAYYSAFYLREGECIQAPLVPRIAVGEPSDGALAAERLRDCSLSVRLLLPYHTARTIDWCIGDAGMEYDGTKQYPHTNKVLPRLSPMPPSS